MSQASVDDILKQIQTLPADDRLLLEERLLGVLEEEWQQAAHEAREEAERRGLDQRTIDTAVRDFRHGR